MYATSTTVYTLQTTTNSLEISGATEADPKAMNSNGPTCCHCGWRGGSHASNCPFK
ncbi:hypothetical protein B0H19DRAFT_1187446 [Mycena capillaripes]|nr:hypothetical protein B0H19DRAFT_1187446 [Mycena capillaripes]